MDHLILVGNTCFIDSFNLNFNAANNSPFVNFQKVLYNFWKGIGPWTPEQFPRSSFNFQFSRLLKSLHLHTNNILLFISPYSWPQTNNRYLHGVPTQFTHYYRSTGHTISTIATFELNGGVNACKLHDIIGGKDYRRWAKFRVWLGNLGWIEIDQSRAHALYSSRRLVA